MVSLPNLTPNIEHALVGGDLSKLSESERTALYKQVCETLGINYLTRPFDYIRLNGKLCLYAKKDCTEQLRRRHRISLSIVSRDRVEDQFIVTARATLPDGRQDESTGAVVVGNQRGDNLSNALMKAETKAKRRVTLSICGLGFLDETELSTIPTAFTPDIAQESETKSAAAALAEKIEAGAPLDEERQRRNYLKQQAERLAKNPDDYKLEYGGGKGKRLTSLTSIPHLENHLAKYRDRLQPEAIAAIERHLKRLKADYAASQAAEELAARPPLQGEQEAIEGLIADGPPLFDENGDAVE